MKAPLVLAFAASVGLAAWLYADHASMPNLPDTSTSSTAAVSPPSSQTGVFPPPSPYAGLSDKRVPLLPLESQLPAAQSLMETRDADPRTPPIIRATAASERASAAELADPKAYAQYEARQNLRVYAAFVAAAKQEVPRLRADVERGRTLGIEQEKIARVEEKIRRIEAMQEQLLREHPQLQTAKEHD